MKKFRIYSLIFLIITAFVSMDLLINLLGSMIPSMNDGIGLHSLIGGYIFFGDDHWSQERFFDAFVISSIITFAVFAENILLSIIVLLNKDKK